MITPEYCQVMSGYNRWQNNSLRSHVKAMSAEELHEDRGVFFSSMMATLNHILWGDLLWIARFDGGADSGVDAKDNTTLTSTKEEWDRLRFLTDARIIEWANQLSAIDLIETVTWHSFSKNSDITQPLSLCVTHFFNHQIHHRGQVHSILTAMGRETIDSDLVFMPEG